MRMRMTTETVYCDRCGSKCNHVEVRGYRLYRNKTFIAKVDNGVYRVAMDLCQNCQDSLIDWIKAGKKAQD
jgi:hypothetical protein